MELGPIKVLKFAIENFGGPCPLVSSPVNSCYQNTYLFDTQAFQISLKGVSSQVSEVMTMGQQLKGSCSEVDDPELDKTLKELTVLWTELDSDLQQRIQYLQGILLRLG